MGVELFSNTQCSSEKEHQVDIKFQQKKETLEDEKPPKLRTNFFR